MGVKIVSMKLSEAGLETRDEANFRIAVENTYQRETIRNLTVDIKPHSILVFRGKRVRRYPPDRVKITPIGTWIKSSLGPLQRCTFRFKVVTTGCREGSLHIRFEFGYQIDHKVVRGRATRIRKD